MALVVVVVEEWEEQPWLTNSQQLKCGDKTHSLQTTSENHRYELYHASGAGSDDALEFRSLIKHSLVVQKAENVTAGVDSALEQLKNSMAAVKEMKEANKYALLVSPRLPTSLTLRCRPVGSVA